LGIHEGISGYKSYGESQQEGRGDHGALKQNSSPRDKKMERNDHYDLARCKGCEFIFDTKRSDRDNLKFVLLEVQVHRCVLTALAVVAFVLFDQS
jgi:hypothetical protein